jgi:hypothetical protein
MLHRFLALTLLAGCTSVTVVPNDDDAQGGDASTGGNPFGGAASGGAPSGGAPSGGGGCAADWLHIVGGTGANWLRSQAVGLDGSVAVTVNNTDDLSVDGVTLDLPPGGFVVLKFGPSGAFEWARRFGQSSQTVILPVAFDPSGNVLVGGVGYQSVDLGAGVSAEHDAAMGYVAKLSAAGDPLWIQSWGVPIESGGVANMALDAGGNIYFQGVLGYEGDPLEWGGFSVGGVTFIGKILPDGTPAWLRGFDGVLSEWRGLATTPQGHVVVGQSLSFDGIFGAVELSTAGDFDALTVELDEGGAVVDARQYGDSNLQRSAGLTIGPAGNRALIGTTWGAIDFGTGPLSAAGANDVFLAGFDAAGQASWAKTAPNEYAPTALAGTAGGELALVVSSEVATGFQCTGAGEPGFVLATIDGSGSCVVDERVAACGDDPYCSLYLAGLDVSAERNVMSGHFSGDLWLREQLFTADIWDGFVMSKSTCF